MAFTIPNLADAAFSPQARVFSVDLDILQAAVGGKSGVSSGCAVTAQGSPNNTVAVASGTVVVAGVEVVVSSGNLTMTAAHATLPRFDLITVNNAGTKAYTAGTAASNPVPPAVPANSVALAQIYVPANDNVINSTQIVDKRVIVPTPVTGSSWTSAAKAADTTRSNTTTLTADPDLLFAMVANGEYRFKGRLFWSQLAASDFDWRHVGPASPTRLLIVRRAYRVTAGTATDVATQMDVAFSAADISLALSTDAEVMTELDGYIHNGANAGNFEIHWAQGTAVAENTIMRAGSYLDWDRVD